MKRKYIKEFLKFHKLWAIFFLLLFILISYYVFPKIFSIEENPTTFKNNISCYVEDIIEITGGYERRVPLGIYPDSHVNFVEILENLSQMPTSQLQLSV